jgi:hypothetical protein
MNYEIEYNMHESTGNVRSEILVVTVDKIDKRNEIIKSKELKKRYTDSLFFGGKKQ